MKIIEWLIIAIMSSVLITIIYKIVGFEVIVLATIALVITEKGRKCR